MYLYGIQIAATNLRGSIHEIEPEEDSRRIVLTRTHDEIAESETILEEDDPNYRHKDDCECDQCTATETDTPHHPNCQCGECHLFEEQPEPVNMRRFWNGAGVWRLCRQQWRTLAKRPR